MTVYSPLVNSQVKLVSPLLVLPEFGGGGGVPEPGSSIITSGGVPCAIAELTGKALTLIAFNKQAKVIGTLA
jgi:hypothetical protein